MANVAPVRGGSVRILCAFPAAVGALAACGPVDRTRTGDVVAERYFRLTQELTVDGEPVTVSAVFHCKSVQTSDISGVASGVRINAYCRSIGPSNAACSAWALRRSFRNEESEIGLRRRSAD